MSITLRTVRCPPISAWSTALAFMLCAISSACARKGAPPSKKDAQQQSQQHPNPNPAPAISPPDQPPNGSPDHLPDGSPDELAPRKLSADDVLARIRASRARATIVNVWASWCGPCRTEFPMLVGLTDNLKQNQVEVMFVSVDEDESLGAAEEFARISGKQPPLLVAQRPLGAFKQGLNPRWKGALPATFLFDGVGKLRYFWGGPVYDHELLPIVDGLLRGEHIDGEAHLGLSPGKDMRRQ